MKYQAIFPLAVSALYLLSVTLSAAVSAADNAKITTAPQPRWFEIEVILFKQVSTDDISNESFTTRNLAAKKNYALDLLASYIQPDIASLKQLLPTCGQASTHFPFNVEPTAIKLWTADKLLKPLEAALTVNSKKQITPEKMSVAVLPSKSDISHNSYSTRLDNIASSPQENYANVAVPVYNQYPSNSQTPLCTIATDVLKQQLSIEQLEHFTPDGYPIKKLTTIINGLEQWRADETGAITWASTKPYLISQDSLRLKSINNRIKRSRDYAPLLHLGWRQIGENKHKAKAINLYAGENLTLLHQQALVQQKTNQQAIALQVILDKRAQALINSVLADKMSLLDNTTLHTSENIVDISAKELSTPIETTVSSISGDSIAETLRLQEKQQQLAELFQAFGVLNDKATADGIEGVGDTENNGEIDDKTISAIIAQLSADINTPTTAQLNAKNVDVTKLNISAPVQNWSIDGLFKIHLDHYLYINSELNFVEPITTTDKSMTAPQVISFKQSRRVITGEIHYFDHPHIGMVVQIRRFDPTKPAAEAVSQAKK